MAVKPSSALAAVAGSGREGNMSHFSAGECGDASFTNGAAGDVLDLREIGAVKNGYYVPFYLALFSYFPPIFSHVSLICPATFSHSGGCSYIVRPDLLMNPHFPHSPHIFPMSSHVLPSGNVYKELS